MAIQRLAIKQFLDALKENVLLDVRSPAEYHHAHIPGAVSFPLFSDEQRKIVGTTYKQQSREEAIKTGLDFFGPKMRRMVEEAEQMVRIQKAKSSNSEVAPNTVFVYCWRGGMRSAGVAWLLDLYGFKVYTLAGGYKAFRNHVLETFEQPFQFKILGGYTGAGKTEVLKELERNGELIVDLEKIACHRGSAFGSHKMLPQPKQEMFENLLAVELAKKSLWNGKRSSEDFEKTAAGSPLPLNPSPIWLEDEAQRIGDLNLPNSLWRTMRRAPLFFLDIPFEERLDYIVEEYGECDVQKLIQSTQRISQRLGGLDTKNTIAFLSAGEIKEAFRILLRYYDKYYLKGLHNRDSLPALLSKIDCKTVTSNNALKLTKPQPV